MPAVEQAIGVLISEIRSGGKGWYSPARFVPAATRRFNEAKALASRLVTNVPHGVQTAARQSPPGSAANWTLAQVLDHLADPNNFATRDNWLLFWTMAYAQYHLIRDVTVQGVDERAHNGSIMGQVLSTAYWLMHLETIDGNAPGLRFVLANMEHGRLETVYGADFAIVVPVAPPDRLKIAFFQAKSRIRDKHRMRLREPGAGPYQIERLLQLEVALLNQVGRPLSSRGSDFRLDAVSYYVAWDRKDLCHPVPFPPMVTAARTFWDDQLPLPPSFSMLPVNSGLCFDDAVDFAGLVALGLADRFSNVGVEVSIGQLQAALAQVDWAHGPAALGVLGVMPGGVVWPQDAWFRVFDAFGLAQSAEVSIDQLGAGRDVEN